MRPLTLALVALVAPLAALAAPTIDGCPTLPPDNAWNALRQSSISKKTIRPAGDRAAPDGQHRNTLMDAVLALAPGGGLTAACDALGASRAQMLSKSLGLNRCLIKSAMGDLASPLSTSRSIALI